MADYLILRAPFMCDYIYHIVSKYMFHLWCFITFLFGVYALADTLPTGDTESVSATNDNATLMLGLVWQ